eukprot:5435772-Prymnesium_polylepis.1
MPLSPPPPSPSLRRRRTAAPLQYTYAVPGGDRRAASALGGRRACRVIGARVPIGSSLRHARAGLGLGWRGPPRGACGPGGSQGVARPSSCARGRTRVASAPPLFARGRGLDRGEVGATPACHPLSASGAAAASPRHAPPPRSPPRGSPSRSRRPAPAARRRLPPPPLRGPSRRAPGGSAGRRRS